MLRLSSILSVFLTLSLASPFPAHSSSTSKNGSSPQRKPPSKFFNYSSTSEDSSQEKDGSLHGSPRKRPSPERSESDDDSSLVDYAITSGFKRIAIESPKNDASDSSEEPLVSFGGVPDFYQEKLRIIEHREQTRVLFVGVHTGVPELAFLDTYFVDHTYSPNQIELSVYDPVKNRPLSDETSYLIDSRGVDVNLLDSPKYESRGFQKDHYDLIIWVGPTFDDSLSDTSRLVETFVKKGRSLLNDNGKIFVVQNILAKNFSNITQIDGASVMEGTILLPGRETLKGKLLPDDRRDHVIMFEKF